MKIIVCLVIFGLINYISSTPAQDGSFNTYIKSMADSLNRKANPCVDFTAFACSNIKKPEPKPDYDQLLYEKIINEKPRTPVEGIMQKYYQSCEKLAGNWPYKPDVEGEINLSKIFGQLDILKANPKWPVETTPDATKLSVLLGETISIYDLTNYILMESNNGKMEIFAPKMGEYPKYQKDSSKMIAETMKTYNPKNEAAIDKAVKDIADFETKLDAILNEKVETVSLPAGQVTGVNWPELLKVVQNNWFLAANIEPIVTDSRIVKIVKLITETDSKTIVNHLIYKIISYVQISTANGCKAPVYFQPGLVDRIWRDTVSEQDHKKYLDTLNLFESGFKDVEKQLGSKDPEHETDQELKLTRECFEKRDEWFKELYYDKVKIEDNNFLQSIMNIGRLPIMSYKRNVRDDITIKMMGFYYVLQQFNEMNLHNTPMLHYFAVKHLNLWSRGISQNLGWIKTSGTTMSECLETKQNIKIPSYDIRDLLEIYATESLNLFNFINYQKNVVKEQMELENKVLKSHSLNHLQAYYISLKQSNCFADSKYLDIVLANRKTFSQAFACTDDQPMNPKEKCIVETFYKIPT